MKRATPPPGTHQVLFTFKRDKKAEKQLALSALHSGVIALSETAQRPFLPLGLFVWGATADTLVERVLIGRQHEASLTQHPIPARFFETGRSMAELQALADAGELVLSVEQRRVIEMEVAEVGNNISLAVRGPFEDVCLWGLTYSQQWPLLTQVIEPVEKPITFGVELGPDWKGFRGRVIEHHLGGDRVISHVYAPSEQSVCQLLLAARRPERLY